MDCWLPPDARERYARTIAVCGNGDCNTSVTPPFDSAQGEPNCLGINRLPSRVYSLSIHADYQCRHSGQCCSVNWDVPVELPVYRSLVDAMTAGRLQVAPSARGLEPFIVDPDLPDGVGAILQRTDDGPCVFFERDSRLCIVHRDLGEPALAATCRHFPRVAVQDARGTFVGLSHFCPTAASMLFRTDVPLGIVGDPPAFPLRDYDGLTIDRDDLPPLLHPTMLMDLDGYSAWEAHMVERCAAAGALRSPESILATLQRDAEVLSAWRPGAVSLREAVSRLDPRFVEAPLPTSLELSLQQFVECLRAVPPELLPDADEERLAEAFDRHVEHAWHSMYAPLSRYVAAKAFASWTAYQGRGVRTIVRGLEAAVSLVRVEAARQCRDAARDLDPDLLLEAFRSADFLLNHQATGEELAESWGRSIGEW